MKNYNSMAFTPEEVDQGLHTDLLNYLFLYNKESKEHYNDVHITTDGYCTIVEWANLSYEGSWGGKFEFVDEDEVVGKDLEFPDGHFELVYKESADEVLKEWLDQHPEYTKDRYGRWVEKIDTENN